MFEQIENPLDTLRTLSQEYSLRLVTSHSDSHLDELAEIWIGNSLLATVTPVSSYPTSITSGGLDCPAKAYSNYDMLSIMSVIVNSYPDK